MLKMQWLCYVLLRLRGYEGIFANSNDIVLFLVKQARCLQHACLMYEEIFKGTLGRGENFNYSYLVCQKQS